MSGGRWGYQRGHLREQAVELAALFQVLGEMEHELDWGVCGDTCLACAELRAGAAMVAYFDNQSDPGPAEAILHDYENPAWKCGSCFKER